MCIPLSFSTMQQTEFESWWQSELKFFSFRVHTTVSDTFTEILLCYLQNKDGVVQIKVQVIMTLDILSKVPCMLSYTS